MIGPVDELVIVQACMRLMTGYAQRIDDGAATATAELFTEDGVYATPGAVCTGRAEIRDFMGRREAMTGRVTRHVVTNIDVRVVDDTRAEGRSICLEFRDDAGPVGPGALPAAEPPAIVGDYRDVFVCEDGVWRFASRRVEVALRRAGELYLTR